MHHEPGFGLVLAAFAMASAAVARVVVVAQEVVPSSPSAWVDNGIAAASVGALIYIARLFAKGDLVARPSAENEAKALHLAESVLAMLEQSHEREVEYVATLRQIGPKR